MAYSGCVVGSKSSVVVGGSSSGGYGGLDGGVGELLIGQRKTRVNEGSWCMKKTCVHRNCMVDDMDDNSSYNYCNMYKFTCK